MCRWFFEEQLGDIVRCRNACRASTNWKLSTRERRSQYTPKHSIYLYLSLTPSHWHIGRERERERERNDLKKAKELKLKRTHIEFWLIFKDRFHLSKPKPKTEIRNPSLTYFGKLFKFETSVRVSVNTFGEISPLWQKCKSLWTIFWMTYFVFGKLLKQLWYFVIVVPNWSKIE